MEEKENFYHELDTNTKHSFCTCQTLALGFVILAIIAALSLVWVVKRVVTAVAPGRQVMATRDDSTALQQKVAELAKAPGASVLLVINERELTSLLMDAISKDPEIPLRNVQVQINPNGIILSAIATKYLSTHLTISVLPKVVDGKIHLELTKIQAGSLSVPTLLTEQIAQKLDDLIMKQLTQVQGLIVKSILLDTGRLTITGLNPS